MSAHHLRARLAALWMVVAILQLTTVATVAAGPKQERFERPNCVVFIDPVAEGETASRIHSGRCFSTFAEAMAYASGGWLQLASNASRDEYSLAELSAATAGVTIIGRDYEDPNYSCNIFGPCLDWTVNNDFGCTGGRNYVAASMPTIGGFNWNDQISSTKAFAGCSTNQNFEHTNYGGAVRNCLPNCATMGVMNDATSSKQWRDL